MYKWVGYGFSLFIAILIAGITLILELTPPTLLGTGAWISSALYWAVMIMILICMYLFAVRIALTEDKNARRVFYGFVDGYFALLFGVAGVFVSIVVLGTDIEAHFRPLPSVWGFNLYFTYALANTVTFFNTVGQANLSPVTAVASLWVIVVSILGIAYLMFFLSLVFWNLRDSPQETIVHQFPTSKVGNSQRKNCAPRPTGSYIGAFATSSRLRRK